MRAHLGALGHAHDRRARARVGAHFGVAGLDAAERPQARRLAAAANGARRSTTLLAFARDEGLDDAVFQRMKADHHQAAARRQQLERRVQALFELLKLGVDENPKSLKCARCRVLARLAGLDRTSHELGKLPRGSNRAPAFAPSNKRLCNLYSKPFFPIVRITSAMWRSSARARNSAALSPRVGVHAHVQRAVETEAEAARGVVDLRRGDARSSSSAVDRADAERGQRRRHLREAAWWMEKRGSSTRVAPEVAAATASGSRSKAIRRPLRDEPRQQQPRVAAAAEGAVDVHAVGVA